MPIHLPPATRRSFLHGLAVGGVSFALPRRPAAAAADSDPAPYVALLADTHIDADPSKVVHKEAFNMSDHLRAVVDDVLAQPTPPAALAVVGDLALKNGRPGDYAQFLKIVAPLRQRGIPVHLTMGNHDDRGPIRDALAAEDDAAVEGRFATVVDAAGVRLMLLDSLDKVDEVDGVLGEVQRGWLAKALDAKPEVATVVLMHHHPSPTSGPAKGSLQDTAALFEILRPRKQVKAVVFGHTHTWRREERDGMHLINLPAVAYHFETPQPLGWCRLEPAAEANGATVELRCIGGDRSKDRERVELSWRGA